MQPNLKGKWINTIEATHVNTVNVRIGSRTVESIDAAYFAKIVFCHSSIALIK